jgi:hypothetical protein
MRRKYMTRLAPEERRAMCEMGNVSKELEDAIKAKQDWASSWWTQFLILFKRTFNERRVDYFSSLKILQVRSKKIITEILPTTMNLICGEISICMSSQNLPQVSDLMGAQNKWNLLIHMKFHFAAAAAAATGYWGSCALGSFMVAFKDTNKHRHTRPGKWEKKKEKRSS